LLQDPALIDRKIIKIKGVTRYIVIHGGYKAENFPRLQYLNFPLILFGLKGGGGRGGNGTKL